MSLSHFFVCLYHIQTKLQNQREEKKYDHMIAAFLRMFIHQREEQIAGFNKSQEGGATMCFLSKCSLFFFERQYKILF